MERSTIRAMAFSFKKIAETLFSFIYPPLCLQCSHSLKRGPLFCPLCLEQLTLLDTQGRCRTCFAFLHKGRCERCIHRPIVISRQLAVCEAMGPAFQLLKGIYAANQHCIAAAGSLMAYQWIEEHMPMPDVIVSMPMPFWQKYRQGSDVYLRLSQELGKILQIPVQQWLKCQWDHAHFLTTGEFSQKMVVSGKEKMNLCDKKILLVSPKLCDALFRKVAQELKPFFPTRVDALAFAAGSE